jgi:hypothetical protein
MWSRHHDSWIAAIVLVESTRWRTAHTSSTLQHVEHLRWIVGIVEIGVELLSSQSTAVEVQ